MAAKPGKPPKSPGVKRVLVTGGAGYIGSALLPLLLDHGYHVRILDLFVYGLDAVEPWLHHPQLEIIHGDFRQPSVVERTMDEVSAVVHLGAIVADQACELDEKLTRQINLTATKTIAKIAKRHQAKRFIFASTCSVYGTSERSLDEQSRLKPVTLYARTKATAEKALVKMADDQFCPVILRFSTVYGLSGRYRFDLVVNLLTAKALVDGEITIFGGNQWRSFVHVEDAARAIYAALEAPSQTVHGEIFNVGSDNQNYTIAQIGELIQQRVPSARIITRDDVVDPQNYRVDCRKIQRCIDFQPRWSVEQGIQQVVDAIRGGEVGDYRDAHYSNIQFLSSVGIKLLQEQE